MFFFFLSLQFFYAKVGSSQWGENVILPSSGEVGGRSQLQDGYVLTGAGSDSVSRSRTLKLGGCLRISGVNLDYPAE